MPRNIVISDASCIIALQNIGYLHLLQEVFDQVHTTPEVESEVGNQLPDWIRIQKVSNIQVQQNFEKILDIGEASAIALAIENQDTLLLIDEIKGREVALKYGLKITGTIGVILSAKEHQIIQRISPLISDLITHGFYISKSLQSEVLKQAGEL